MKKLFLVLMALGIFSLASTAQSSYSTAIGVRLSSSVPAVKSGITVKHFFGSSAIEGILSFGDGSALCGLYEIHKPLGIQNLQWLIGAGGYVGLSSDNKKVGAAGIIGLDYKFPILSLNITAD